MGRTLTTAERRETDHDVPAEETPEVLRIEELITQCNRQMDSVTDVLSAATRTQTRSMYQEFLREAVHSPGLRTKRLTWMEEAAASMQHLLVRAPEERRQFLAELTDAVEKKWIPSSDIETWKNTFDDPGQLEMYRSQWLKETWKKKYVAGWEELADERTKALKRAKDAGMNERDLPELAAVKNDDAFLAKKFPGRRSAVKALDAAITAAENGTLRELRTIEPLLSREATGPARCLHQAKVGLWLKKVAANSGTYTKEVLTGYIREWRAARARYDDLAMRYEEDGRPDGCAPMSLNAFLESSYDDRMVALNEWQNRLDAADRMKLGADDVLERKKLTIRRALDLKDVDIAAKKLEDLRAEHPDDADVRSMTAYVATLRAEALEKGDADQDARTEEALRELQAMPDGVPSVLTKHYKDLIERGDADQAAAFFLSMRARTDRRKAGKTDDADELMAAEVADEAEEATVVTERTDDKTDDTELVVTKDTPPSETFALIKAHAVARMNRAPALIIEGLPYAQQLQMVELNGRALSHMRHLDSVGKPYQEKAAAQADAALAA